MDDATSPPRPQQPFRVSRTGGAGLSRAQSRSVRFLSPSPGVRMLRGLGAEQQRQAAVLGAGSDAVLTDLSAARHWSIPVPPWLRTEPDAVTVSRPAGGPRVTTPARTWLDCAAVVPLVHLVAMGDHLLRHGLATVDALEQVVAWGRRRRGVATARAALPLLDPRAESPQESVVRAHCLLAGLPRPVCNLDVLHEGVWLARVDLAWPEARLAVEYDGAVHLDEAQRRRDAWRRDALQRAGWLVITLTADDLRNPALMCRRIAEALADRLPTS